MLYAIVVTLIFTNEFYLCGACIYSNRGVTYFYLFQKKNFIFLFFYFFSKKNKNIFESGAYKIPGACISVSFQTPYTAVHCAAYYFCVNAVLSWG